MENKNNLVKALSLMIAICIFFNIYAKANVDKQMNTKAKTEIPGKTPFDSKDSIDYRDSVSLIREQAFDLFKDKILLWYLYDDNCDKNIKEMRRNSLIPEKWHRVSDKSCKSVMNYSGLTSDKGTEDAKMFWSIVKDAMFNRKPDGPRVSAARTDSNLNHVLGDTIVSRYINKDLDTMITTYILGGKYIDFNNQYVAKYMDEIKQICADMKRIQAAEMKKQLENTQSR